jgi:hypothetical protein
LAVKLPERDFEFLKEKEYNFELLEFQGGLYLIINDFPFPPAYSPQTAKTLIVIPVGYPDSGLDMFFTIPDVKLTNGNWPQSSEAHVIHNELNWQQWSRHYNWRPGTDNLRSFITAMKQELENGK